MTRRVASLAALAGVLLALTACATPAGSGSGDQTPEASPSESGVSGELEAAWLDGGRMVGLVTSGSSTCLPTVSDVALEANVLTVALADVEPDQPCTRDYVPRLTLVQLPEGVDPAQNLRIATTGAYVGETELDGVEGLAGGGETDYLPSAGWTDTDGQFALVTWGSSGCPPVVEDVAATGPTEITLTFKAPPADQICTADMGPRGTLASVTGLESDVGVELVLAGDGFDGTRVPITGTN